MTLQLNFLEITTLCLARNKFQSLGHLFIQMILCPSALCICLFCVFFRFSALLCMSWFSSPTAFAIWKTKRNRSQDEIWLFDAITSWAGRSFFRPRFQNHSVTWHVVAPHTAEVLNRTWLHVQIWSYTLHRICSCRLNLVLLLCFCWEDGDEEMSVYRFFQRSVGRSCRQEHADSRVECERTRETWDKRHTASY